jgi:hypothetical protein
MENRHLNGWKEIGSYLGRAARTAQRWEAQLGMPVHRPATKKRTVVIGFPDELDTWLVRSRAYFESSDSYETTDSIANIAALNEKLTRLQTEATQLALDLKRVRGDVAHLPESSSTDVAVFPE